MLTSKAVDGAMDWLPFERSKRISHNRKRPFIRTPKARHVRTVFLGWNRPALAQAAELLLDRYSSGGTADLSGAIAVLPGARAGRRLLELLVERAEERQAALVPPSIVTLGTFPEKLYEPKGRFADRLSCQLAWLRVLRELDAELLQRIVPEPPDRRDPLRWLGLADLVARMHVELAGQGFLFADVVSRGFLAEETIESGRWQTLAALQEAYAQRLKRLGLVDAQLARLDAVNETACRTEREVFLIGVADLPQIVEKMLDQVADRVTALVYAPRELADRFTKLGAIVVPAWRQAELPVEDEQLVVVDGPADQATAVVEALAEYDGRYTPDEITVGVPDASVVPYLERRFEQFAIPTRYAEALRMKQTAPYRLLAAVADYLDGRRFADFAALVRHPDLAGWLEGTSGDGIEAGNWLAALDAWYARHLQTTVDDGLPDGRQPAAGSPYNEPLSGDEDSRKVAALADRVNQLCQPFADAQPLADCAQRIAALLVAVYGPQPLDGQAGRVVLEACDAIHAVLLEAVAADAKLAGRWKAADAIRLLLRQIDDSPVPPEAGAPAVELLGWLELPLDDAPVLVVTGLNDGFVPSFINADPFLPNALRRRVGLVDNERRYARDAYALAVLLGSRRVRLVAGRRSAEGDPLTPSRLAFACPRERIPRRVLAYFGGEEARAPEPRVPHGLLAGRGKSAFEPPRPRPPKEPITSMRVTQFRDYLTCPYRYYLRHVLNLRGMNDLAEELDPPAFGSLAHEVLSAFGADPDNSRLVDAERIARVLDGELERIVRRIYGKRRLPAVNVQVAHLRLRLDAFARWQASWAALGWRIVATEVEVGEGAAALRVDGEPMFLRARIDRIDRHDAGGRHVIFDYKTSDAGHPPDKIHRKQDRWVDLQLPLYRHLTKAVGVDAQEVALGYVVLPKDVAAVCGHLAEWQPDDLALADATAAEVVRQVRAGNFWPPALPAPDFDEFTAICLGWNGETDDPLVEIDVESFDQAEGVLRQLSLLAD
jgi:ATP-dependent helicase/nuclease subunit B